MTTATLAHQARTVDLTTLPSVSLDELLAQAELQTRIDRKYVLDADAVGDVLGAVEGLRVLEIDARRTFGYLSVYFDTPDLAAFHDAGRGRRRRFKVRTRVYTQSGDAMLEVKTRGPRGTTVKTRLPYDLADAARLTDAGREFVAATLAEHHVDGVDVGALAPSLHTAYDRSTLLLAAGADGQPSRATIDTNLVWRRPDTQGEPLRGAGMAIVETKGGSSPSALDKALWRQGIRPARISKYGTGLAALDSGLPANKWRRTLTRHLAQAS